MAEQFESNTAASAMIAAQQDVRGSGRYMTLSKFDFPFRSQATTFHPAARALYAVIPWDGVFLYTAKQWSHKQTMKQTERLVYLNKNVERTLGIIAKSISTYERPYTSDGYPMSVLSVTRVPKQGSQETACLVIRLTHAMAGGEDNDLQTTDRTGETVWKKGAERKIAVRESQRNPEVIIASLINRTHFREYKELGSSSVNAKNGVSKEVQNAYRHENFHKFMSFEQYKDMCLWYCSDKQFHPDEYQSCGINDQQNPLNPFNVFTLERACMLAQRYGADRGYTNESAWETGAGGGDYGMRVYNTPFDGQTTFRLQLKEFGPDDLPRFLFPWEKRPEPLETDAMFLHLRTRFGYDLAQSEEKKKEIIAQAKETMQFQCIQHDSNAKNNLFTLKDRFQSELELEMKKANGNLLDEQRIMNDLSRKHMAEFLQVFQRNGDVPKALRSVASYIEDEIAANPTLSMPVNKWTKNLTWAQEQRAAMLPCLENLDKMHTSHRDFAMVQYVVRHVYWRTDLHPNIYIYGDYAVGKSFIYKLIGNKLIPGSFKNYTSSTARADFQESSDEFDMMIEINEEANPRLFSSDVKQGGGMAAGFGGNSTMDDSGQNSEAAAFRARLTSGVLAWKACGIVDGIRFRQDVTIPANTLYLVASNQRKERVPANMMSRFIAVPVHAKERKDGTLLHKMIASKRELSANKHYKRLWRKRYCRNQALTAYVAIGMWLGKTVLQPITTLVSDTVFLAAIDRSRTAGLTGTGDIRRFENLRNLVDIICVDDAISFLLDSPLSPINGERWDWQKHFPLLNPLLRTETEQAVFALELMGSYEDPMEYHLYRAINKTLQTGYEDEDDTFDGNKHGKAEGKRKKGGKESKAADSKKSGDAKAAVPAKKGGQQIIASYINPGPGAGIRAYMSSSSSSHNAMQDDDVKQLPYIRRRDGTEEQEQEQQPPDDGKESGQAQFSPQVQQDAEPGLELPSDEEMRVFTKDQIDEKNYVIMPWQDYEDGNKSRSVFNDWGRCELLWRQIYDKVEGVKCTPDEGVHFLFSRLSQRVPCAVQDGVTIPAMAFAGNRLYISRAVLSGNAQFRLRDSIVAILSKPHMRQMTYLMGQTDVHYPYIWYTKDMRGRRSLGADVKKEEPLKIFNLNFMDSIDKQIITNLFEKTTVHEFKSWADEAMQTLLQSNKYEVLDTDLEEYAQILRMYELNWDISKRRQLLAPSQDAKDPEARPFLIPWQRDQEIRRLARKAVADGKQPALLDYPDCYYTQLREKKDSASESQVALLSERKTKLIEIRAEGIKRAYADWEARGVRAEEHSDEPPPLESAQAIEGFSQMDLGADGKEGKQARGEHKQEQFIPSTPLRRNDRGQLIPEEAHPELDESSMFDDDNSSSRSSRHAHESKSDQLSQGELDFTAFNAALPDSNPSTPQRMDQHSYGGERDEADDWVKQRQFEMQQRRMQERQQEEEQGQEQPQRSFGFVRKLTRLAGPPARQAQPGAADPMEV